MRAYTTMANGGDVFKCTRARNFTSLRARNQADARHGDDPIHRTPYIPERPGIVRACCGDDARDCRATLPRMNTGASDVTPPNSAEKPREPRTPATTEYYPCGGIFPRARDSHAYYDWSHAYESNQLYGYPEYRRGQELREPLKSCYTK